MSMKGEEDKENKKKKEGGEEIIKLDYCMLGCWVNRVKDGQI